MNSMHGARLASPSSTRSWRRTWLLLAIVLLAFVLRVWRLDFQSLWRDEVDALRFATRPLTMLLGAFSKPGENGPLFFLLLRPWLRIVGESEFALRFFSVLWGTLIIPLTWLVIRRLARNLGRGGAAWRQLTLAAGLALLLLAASPYLIWYSQEGKMYALVTALALASLAALLWALAPGAGHVGGRWLLYITLTSLGFYLHVMLVLMLPAHAILFALHWPASRRRLGGGLIALASFILPYLPLVWWQWRLFTSPTFDPGFEFVSLPRALAILLAAFGRGVRATPTIGLVAVWVFCLLTACALALRRAHPWQRLVLFLCAWLLLPPLLLHMVTLRVPLFNDRYLIFIGPAFYLLCAIGVILMAQQNRALALAALVLALTLDGIGVVGQAVTPIKSDFRAAAAFVQAKRAPADVLVFCHPYNRFVFAYYAGWDYAWREASFTNDAQRVSGENAGAQIGQLLEGAEFAWLIEAECEAWDRRGINRRWLDAHGQSVAEASVTGVRVTRWRLR